MFSFFAKFLLLVAAAFGLGTLFDRRDRSVRKGEPGTAYPGTSSATPSQASAAPEPVSVLSGADLPSPTGRRAAEPARPVVADDPLREKYKAEPFQKNFRSVDYSRLSLDQAAIEAEREKRRRSSWVGPLTDRDGPGRGGPGQGGGVGTDAGDGAAAPQRAESAGRFASFGGATVAADVIRGKSDDRVPNLMPTLPGDHPDAPTRPAAPNTGASRSSLEAPLPTRRPGLGDPHPDGPTPPREARARTRPDPLAEKHRAAPFDRDFRTVDYGRLGGPSEAVKPDDRTSGVAAPMPEDTVQRPEIDEAVADSDGAYPAAFRVLGVSGPVQGADGGGSEGDGEADPEGRQGREDVEVPGSMAGALHPTPSPTPLGAPGAQEGAMGMEPERLSAPRGDKPDDLTRIKGIGPAIERILFEHGIYHFDQIAGWGAAEARWIEQMIGFAGRVEREGWIAQAAEFSGTAS